MHRATDRVKKVRLHALKALSLLLEKNPYVYTPERVTAFSASIISHMKCMHTYIHRRAHTHTYAYAPHHTFKHTHKQILMCSNQPMHAPART